MTPRKLSVAVAYFPYSGTSSGSSQVFEITPWSARVAKFCHADPRIDRIHFEKFNDTPITMTRNDAVVWAKQHGIDVLVMIDSDMRPDLLFGKDPAAKPFFESSFEFLYANYDRGPNVICAPYCGPPYESPVYCFRWIHGVPARGENMLGALEMYPRDMAAQFTGILPIAAAPTGLIMFDMRAFDLAPPSTLSKRQVLMEFQAGGLSLEEAMRHLEAGWFYYEWENQTASKKASTEDVTATRDMSLAGWAKFGRDVMYCNWDAWAGHDKVVTVGKPDVLGADFVAGRLRQALSTGLDSRMRVVDLDLETGDADEDGAGGNAGELGPPTGAVRPSVRGNGFCALEGMG